MRVRGEITQRHSTCSLSLFFSPPPPSFLPRILRVATRTSRRRARRSIFSYKSRHKSIFRAFLPSSVAVLTHNDLLDILDGFQGNPLLLPPPANEETTGALTNTSSLLVLAQGFYIWSVPSLRTVARACVESNTDYN